jgi:hypothetical protein
MEMLTTLRNIRAAMASSGGSTTNSKELQALKEENKHLMKVNTKQRYRIDHLVDGMQELQKKLDA